MPPPRGDRGRGAGNERREEKNPRPQTSGGPQDRRARPWDMGPPALRGGADHPVFLASNNLDLRLYRLSYPPEEEPAFERKDFMWIDHRGGAEYLAQQAGTASVISNMGAYVQLFEATKCSCNYGAEYFPYAPLFYDYVGQGHTYLEKFAGAQTLRNPQELQEAFYQNKKLYLGMSAVDRLAGYSPEFFEFLQSHCQPVYNTFSLQVFLWNR